MTETKKRPFSTAFEDAAVAAEAEAAAKRVRFGITEDSFPPSAVPSLYDLARQAGVLELLKDDSKGFAPLLSAFCAQESKLTNGAPLVHATEMAALATIRAKRGTELVAHRAKYHFQQLRDSVLYIEPTAEAEDDADVDEIRATNDFNRDVDGQVVTHAEHIDMRAQEFEEEDAWVDLEDEDFDEDLEPECDLVSLAARLALWPHLVLVGDHATSRVCKAQSSEAGSTAACNRKLLYGEWLCADHAAKHIGLRVAISSVTISGSCGVQHTALFTRGAVPEGKSIVFTAGQVIDVVNGCPIKGLSAGLSQDTTIKKMEDGKWPASVVVDNQGVIELRPGVWVNTSWSCPKRFSLVKYARKGSKTPNAEFQYAQDKNGLRIVVLRALVDLGCNVEIVVA